jgi:YjjG family noncanonical pyrimidine nucleotidase
MSSTATRNYKCIFFDLDHTLWDYETNSKETLCDLYYAHDLKSKGITSAEHFYDEFRQVNIALWDLYDRELITHDVIRADRFKQILEHFSAYDEALSLEISAEYLNTCPKKANLIPHAEEVLDYLSTLYKLTVVTNGLEEIQHVKLKSANLHRYFNHIITSQKAGHRKPSQKIFEYAMNANAMKCNDVIMIGDNLITDIAGARSASIATVFFNPDKISHNEEINHEISCLSELKNIL